MGLRTLYTESQIQERISQLAERIQADYGDETILMIGVLKGAAYFVTDLSRCLGENLMIDFVQVSSYGSERSSSGVVKILKDADISMEGRHVLIVEDIVDTGLTLNHLREIFSTRKPKSLKVAALLSKPGARKVSTEVEYLGFEIENHYVVGYGLDDAEKFRNLRFIGIVQD